MSGFAGEWKLQNGAVIAVVGCGGKTSLIRLLARQNKQKKVLVSPTTKMFPLAEEEAVNCVTIGQCKSHEAQTGVQCMGVRQAETGKLAALPADFLRKIVKDYTLVLLEADGSKGLPCKGWGENEPVIPEYVTHTIGVVPVMALDAIADEACVLRLPAFLQLTGLQKGQRVSTEAVANMVGKKDGMFRNAVGKKTLFVNQVESERAQKKAWRLLKMIDERWPERFDGLYYGSVKNEELHKYEKDGE